MPFMTKNERKMKAIHDLVIVRTDACSAYVVNMFVTFVRAIENVQYGQSNSELQCRYMS